MASASRKYVLDTHLFIRAFRDVAANEALRLFHQNFAPFQYLNAVVVQELRSGIRSREDRRLLERHVLGVFERAGRVIVPSADAWHRSGNVLAAVAAAEGLDVGRVSKAFGNDVLLALSCRESGCVLVTSNDRDFRRIRQHVAFEFTAPWPERA